MRIALVGLAVATRSPAGWSGHRRSPPRRSPDATEAGPERSLFPVAVDRARRGLHRADRGRDQGAARSHSRLLRALDAVPRRRYGHRAAADTDLTTPTRTVGIDLGAGRVQRLDLFDGRRAGGHAARDRRHRRSSRSRTTPARTSTSSSPPRVLPPAGEGVRTAALRLPPPAGDARTGRLRRDWRGAGQDLQADEGRPVPAAHRHRGRVRLPQDDPHARSERWRGPARTRCRCGWTTCT